MSPAERREVLLDVLCRRRHDTCKNLAHEFGVSERTIRRDIEALTCSYPIETVFGGHGGGIRVKDGFYIHHRQAIHSGLTPKQTALLQKICGLLDGDDLDTLNNILSDFSP